MSAGASVLDERAKREYGEHALAPSSTIAAQIASSVGLGGRDRKLSSDVERVRINVQRRIKDAIQRIGEHDAELARYLAKTIKTGNFCAYDPL